MDRNKISIPLKIIAFLIHSRIFIGCIAFMLCLQTQLQLGITIQFRPYLGVVFFGALLAYHLNHLKWIIQEKYLLNEHKYLWLREHLSLFYVICALSFIGFLISFLFVGFLLQIILLPFLLITLFYSLPVFSGRYILFNLREIPHIKIFLISFVWTSITVILPVLASDVEFKWHHVIWMCMERFIFAFAITLPFDIRDMEVDFQSGLKTIPHWLNKKNTIHLSNLLLLTFFLICSVHYFFMQMYFFIPAYFLSAASAFVFMNVEKIKRLPFYYEGILDGSLLFQTLYVCIFAFLSSINL